LKHINVLKTFISKYINTHKFCDDFKLALIALFIGCMLSFKCYSQQSCVFLEYEDVVCSNEPIQFALKTKGSCIANTIVWVFNNTLNNVDTLMGAGPHPVSFEKPGLVNFSISYYDFQLKTQVYKEPSFEVIAPVIKVVIEPQNPCIGQTIKLKAEGHKEGFFVWKGAIQKQGENLFEVTDSIKKDNQEYILQWFLGTNGTDRGCRFRSFTNIVKTEEMPPLLIEPSNEISICEGELVNLKIKNVSNTNDYIWRSEDLVVNNTSLDIKPTNSTNINISTFENGCLRSENVVINVQKVPSFSIQPNNVTVCKGSILQLGIVANNFENEISYSWSGGATTYLDAFGETVEIVPTLTTTYTANWEHNGCKASASSTIDLSESTTNIIGDKIINICSGETVKLTVNTPNKGIIKWYDKDFDNPVEAPTLTVSPEKTTTYEVYWNDGNCSDNGTVTVQVTPKPEFGIASSVGNRVCKGEPINLQVDFTNGNFSNNFSWSLEEDQNSLTIDNNQLSFIATKSSNITVVWLDTDSVCNNVVSQNLYIDVLTRPEVITLNADRQQLCEGETVKLSVGGADLANFILYNADTEEKISDTFEGSSIKITPQKTTNYVAWWLNIECIIISDTIKVTVNEIPTIDVNNNEKICPNSHFEINIQPTNYSLYLWSGGDIPDIDIVTGTKLSRKVKENNISYSLRINDNNCILDTLITLDVVNLDVKVVSDKPANEVCEGESAQLSVNGADTYFWEEDKILSGDLSNKPVAYPTENVTTLSVNAYKDGCLVNDNIELYLKEKPTASVSNNATICYGDTVQLSGNGGQNYLWHPNLFLDDNTSQNPIAQPNESIQYTLTAIAENGCTDEATIAVNVQNDGCEIDLNKIFVPNTITPNRDRINDYWEIPAIADLQDYQVTVFTDVGAIVFISKQNGYQNEFNGVNNGNFLPEGTYYYIIQHLKSQSKKTGTLTIIR